MAGRDELGIEAMDDVELMAAMKMSVPILAQVSGTPLDISTLQLSFDIAVVPR